MPEGPSLVIIKEEVQLFNWKKILSVSGNAKQEIGRMEGQKITDFKTWGKHFLICFKGFTVRVHFLLFGKYAINEKRPAAERLSLQFANGELNLYNCAIKFIEEPLDEVYDWTADVLNENWDAKAARKKLKAMPNVLVADALLDQTIFSGVGNIIKNEVLYRIKVHPESTVAALPARKLTQLTNEASQYSYDFLTWKKDFVFKKKWKAHTKKTCERCNIPLIKKHVGKTARRSFFCENCQVKYV